MKIKQTILVFALLIGFSSFFVAPFASAAAGDICGTSTLLAGQSCCAGVPVSIVACPGNGGKTTDPTKTGIWSLLLLVINILTAGVVIAALGGVVYGSILYTTAGGSPDQVKKARTIIGNVIVGILVYALMYSFMNFIIPGGLFT